MRTEFHTIGLDHPVYLIAEIGLNHNGSEELALKMVEASARSGANCAKFQLFDSKFFINRKARLGNNPPGSLQEFFSQFELPEESWTRIVQACKKNGLDFLCSVFDEPSLDLYMTLGNFPVKIASTDLTCRPLLESVLRRKLPMYLSTGAANEEEVERTIQWIGTPALLLQCVSSYPARAEDYNLRVLPLWQKKYNCLTGISDHCTELDVSLQMPALGGVAIERHFTLDRSMEGPDHKLSSTPEDFASLRKRLDVLKTAMGDGLKKCMPSEEPVRAGGRRSVYYRNDLPAGHTLAESDLIVMRPAEEIPAERLPELEGRDLLKGVGTADPVRSSDIRW